MLLDFLAEMQVDLDATLNVPILDRAIHLAKFVLSQQDRWQRDNSRIIAKFRDIGKEDVALGLAEEYMVTYIHIIKVSVKIYFLNTYAKCAMCPKTA